MADDKYDELVRVANAKATQQAYNQIQADIQGNAKCYWDSIASGKTDDAGWFLRNHRNLELEAQALAGTAQQQQAQQQFTQAEQDLLRDFPEIARDPQKWHTALAASNNLQLRGYDRNSAEYIQAVAHAAGVLNADMTESLEVASPNEALRICQSKYGEVDADTYNQGVARLIEDKRAGKYPNSQ
jgi:hypothetical protein